MKKIAQLSAENASSEKTTEWQTLNQDRDSGNAASLGFSQPSSAESVCWNA
jgi:hypothetical protein